MITAPEVAKVFAHLLEMRLGRAKFDAVKREGEQNYDRHCDTNMVMQSALEVCEVEVWEADQMPDAVIDLWNEAWDVAIRNRLI